MKDNHWLAVMVAATVGCIVGTLIGAMLRYIAALVGLRGWGP